MNENKLSSLEKRSKILTRMHLSHAHWTNQAIDVITVEAGHCHFHFNAYLLGSCLLKMEQNEDPLSAVNLIKASLKDQKKTKG